MDGRRVFGAMSLAVGTGLLVLLWVQARQREMREQYDANVRTQAEAARSDEAEASAARERERTDREGLRWIGRHFVPSDRAAATACTALEECLDGPLPDLAGCVAARGDACETALEAMRPRAAPEVVRLAVAHVVESQRMTYCEALAAASYSTEHAPLAGTSWSEWRSTLDADTEATVRRAEVALCETARLVEDPRPGELVLWLDQRFTHPEGGCWGEGRTSVLALVTESVQYRPCRGF